MSARRKLARRVQLADLRRQHDRESALRRALCAACPRVPFGMVSAMVHELVAFDLELEAQGENLR